jgi:hypothetical protein
MGRSARTAGAVGALAVIGLLAAGCFRANTPPPPPLASPTPWPPATPSPQPVRGVPDCVSVRPYLARYVPGGSPVADQPPVNNGTTAEASCGMQGVLAFTGHPGGRLYVEFGRAGPNAGHAANDRAACLAGDHLRGTCQETPAPIGGGYYYGQTCGGDSPVRQETGAADGGAYITVTFYVDAAGASRRAALRTQLIAASTSLVSAVMARLNP